MIAFVRGTLFEKRLSPPSAILEAGGVGYELFVPLSTYDALPREGEPCLLLAHDYVREDARLLYGFATAAERDLFLLLQGVSGVGPKTALGALSGAPARQIKAWIAAGDAKMIAKLPGLGKRTAERLCVELKGRIDPLEAAAADTGADESPLPQACRDAVLALVQLGQPEDVAVRRIREIAQRPGAPADTAALVRLALSAR